MARPRSGATGSEPEKGPFIFVTASAAKLDPATRKQVRSHVMRGKNRKPLKAHGGAALGSWINGRQAPGPNSRVVGRWTLPHRIVGNDLALVSFPDEMKPYMLELLFSWFTVLKHSMYPLEAIVQPSDALWLKHLASDRALLHTVLCSAQAVLDFVREARLGDKAMYHLTTALHTLRQTLAYAPTVSDTTIGTVLILTILSDSVGEPSVARQHMQGLYELVKMRGGLKALRHNGELQAKVLRADLGFAINAGTKPLFFAEGFSWDPYLVLRTDKNTEKKGNTNKRDTAASTQSSPMPQPSADNPLCPGVQDPRLLNTLLDLQEFARAANLAFHTGHKIAPDLFRETLVSVQYRLLALRDEGGDEDVPSILQSGLGTWSPPRDSLFGDDEVESETDAEAAGAASCLLLRLGMLAFTTTTFLYIKELPARDTDLARRVRTCLRAMTHLPPPSQPHYCPQRDTQRKDISTSQRQLCRLALWFVFTARVSVLRRGVAGDNADEDALLVPAAAQLVAVLGLKGWTEVRDVLREYMWIDWLHSGDGKALWEKVVVELDVASAEEESC